MPPILAHLGHWYEVTPYVGPVVIMALWLGFQAHRGHQEEEEEG